MRIEIFLQEILKIHFINRDLRNPVTKGEDQRSQDFLLDWMDFIGFHEKYFLLGLQLMR